MKIQKINKDNWGEYTAFVSKYGTVFSQPSWISIYDSCLQVYGIYNNDELLIGSFCLYHSKIAGINHIKNPPYSPSIALVLNNSTKNKSNSLSFEKSIISLIATFISKLPYSILTIAFPSEYKDMQPFFWKNYKVIPNYTYKYTIKEKSEDELKSYLSPERRNDIKKAEKDGIVVKFTNDYKETNTLIHKTFQRKEKKINKAFIEKIVFEFANPNNSFAFVAYQNNMPIACSFCIYDQHTAYYLLGGYDSKNKHQGAGAYVLWNSILKAKKMGLTCFDFEGSMLQPVEKFFRGFGPDLIPYFTINKGILPVEIVLKLFKRAQF